MRRLLLLTTLALAGLSYGEIYSLLYFTPRSTEEMDRFSALGPDIVHVYEDGSADFIVNSQEYPEFLGSGLRIATRMDNLERFYARRSEGRSMGGFLTWDELSVWMDDLHDTYPSITSAPTSIGDTYEGRPQAVVKISSNNDFWFDDPALPNVWYDGLIHSREPVTMQNICSFMLWLCENYDGNGFCSLQATWLLDHREIWCLPCNNVDGYVYNQTTSPGGGGMHRKNRNTSAGGDGVDLNRNWSVAWGGEGSSSSPSSETYCGTGPLSESETANIDAFWQDHIPAEVHSSHSYGNILIYPWGWTDEPTTHAAEYSTHGGIMSSWGTGDPHGPAYSLSYPASGNTRDHAYAVYGAMSWNHETGSDYAGFWPDPVETVKLTRRNLRSYLVTAFLAGCPLDPHVPGTPVVTPPGLVSPPFDVTWSAVSGAAAYALQELEGYEAPLDDAGTGGPFALDNWSLSTAQYHSSPQSYHSNGTGTMTWTSTVTIPEDGGGRLGFWSWYSVPYGSCQGSVEVSTNGGADWMYLQTFGRTDQTWRYNIHELDEWQGQTLSFRWATVGSSSSLYIDDIKVEVWDSNEFVDLDVPGTTYTFDAHEQGEFWFRAVAMDADFGPGWPSAPAMAEVIDTGIGELPEPGFQGATSLGAVSPNPSISSAAVQVSVSRMHAGAAGLRVYDLAGRAVADLSPEVVSAGSRLVSWDLRYPGGAEAPGGIYYLVLDAPGMRLVRSFVVAR
jgi:hypothetical protein